LKGAALLLLFDDDDDDDDDDEEEVVIIVFIIMGIVMMIMMMMIMIIEMPASHHDAIIDDDAVFRPSTTPNDVTGFLLTSTVQNSGDGNAGLRGWDPQVSNKHAVVMARVLTVVMSDSEGVNLRKK